MSRTMLYERVGRTLVVVHTAAVPSDLEWDAWIERMSKLDYSSILVVTAGGGPTYMQRTRTNDFWKGKAVPAFAMITSSRLAVGLVIALNRFLNYRFKAFLPVHQEEALQYIDVPFDERASVRAMISRLQERLAS